VRLAATEILQVAGLSGYHTSIIVDDREFFFDCLGIMLAPPLWSHLAGPDQEVKGPEDVRTEVIEIGRSLYGGKAMVEALSPYFGKGSYDIFYKNCNTFTDAALYFLTRTRLPGRFNRIERLVTATNPVSTNLINRLFRSLPDEPTAEPPDAQSGEHVREGHEFYVPNPESEGFCVDDILSTFSDSDSDSDGSSDSEAAALRSGPWPQQAAGGALRPVALGGAWCP